MLKWRKCAKWIFIIVIFTFSIYLNSKQWCRKCNFICIRSNRTCPHRTRILRRVRALFLCAFTVHEGAIEDEHETLSCSKVLDIECSYQLYMHAYGIGDGSELSFIYDDCYCGLRSEKSLKISECIVSKFQLTFVISCHAKVLMANVANVAARFCCANPDICVQRGREKGIMCPGAVIKWQDSFRCKRNSHI